MAATNKEGFTSDRIVGSNFRISRSRHNRRISGFGDKFHREKCFLVFASQLVVKSPATIKLTMMSSFDNLQFLVFECVPDNYIHVVRPTHKEAVRIVMSIIHAIRKRCEKLTGQIRSIRGN